MKFLMLIFMMMASFSVSAIPETEIVIATDIPEDYGIEFPRALHLDHLYFSTEEAPTERRFVRSMTIDAGETDRDGGNYELNLLYYGNLSRPYDIVLSAESVGGFRLKDSQIVENIPLDVRFERPETLSDEIEVDINDDGSAHLSVNAIGPVRGVEVLDMVCTWIPASDTVPGEYIADIVVRMEAL